MDGYAVARAFRTIRDARSRPDLIALTGYGQEEDRGGRARRASTGTSPSPPTPTSSARSWPSAGGDGGFRSAPLSRPGTRFEGNLEPG